MSLQGIRAVFEVVYILPQRSHAAFSKIDRLDRNLMTFSDVSYWRICMALADFLPRKKMGFSGFYLGRNWVFFLGGGGEWEHWLYVYTILRVYIIDARAYITHTYNAVRL